MKKTTKVVLGSVMTMAMCASLIAGSTLALFSSEDSVNIAVTSGKVDVKATIDGTPTIDSTVEEGNPMGSISVDGNKVVLDKFTPGDYADVGIKVTNYSTIAVKWQLMVSLAEESDVDLYKAMTFEVTSTDYSDLGDFVDLTGNRKETKWHNLSAASSTDGEKVATLNVHVAFPETAEGAALMDKTCTIVLAVKATQGNAHTADPIATAYNVDSAADLTALGTVGTEAMPTSINLLDDIEVKGTEGEALANFTQLTGFQGEFNGNGFTITYAGTTDPEEFIKGLTAAQGPALKTVSLEDGDSVPPTVKDLTVRNAVSFGKKVTWDKNGAKTRVFQVNNLEGLKYFRDTVNLNGTKGEGFDYTTLWPTNTHPYTGETVELTQDIDLGGNLWFRIGVNGNYKRFGGTFNGNGYEIKNVKVAKAQDELTAEAMEIGEIFYTLNNNGTTLNTALTGDAVLNYTVHNEGDLEQIYTWKGYKNSSATTNNNYDIGGERTWIVNTAAGLALFRDRVNNVQNADYPNNGKTWQYRSYQYDVVKLGADITLEDGEGEANWARIGTGFTGVFDSQGYEIKNVKVAYSVTDSTKYQEWAQVFSDFGVNTLATIHYTLHNEGGFEQLSTFTKEKNGAMYADHQWYINSAEGFEKFASIVNSGYSWNTSERNGAPIGFGFAPTGSDTAKIYHSHTINLAADIDVGEYEYFNYYQNTSNSNWLSRRSFQGVFDGHGHTIFYTNVKRPGSAEMGRLVPQANVVNSYTNKDYIYTAKIMNLEMAVSGEFADKLGSYVSVYDANGNFTPAKWSLTTAQHLMNFRDLVNGGRTFMGETVEIANDIDVSSANWVGIGTKEHPFMGSFNGNGHTVKYKIDETLKAGVNTYALFAFIENAKIDHLTVTGSIALSGAADTEKYYYAAGIVGQAGSTWNLTANITRCTSDVDIDISKLTKISKDFGIGGIVASSYEGSCYVENCLNTGNVTIGSTWGEDDGVVSARLYVGGIGAIVGKINDSSPKLYANNCINRGVLPYAASFGDVLTGAKGISAGQIAGLLLEADDSQNNFYAYGTEEEAPSAMNPYTSSIYQMLKGQLEDQKTQSETTLASKEAEAESKPGDQSLQREIESLKTQIQSAEQQLQQFEEMVANPFPTVHHVDMTDQSAFEALDFVNVWKMTSDGPVLR